MNKKLQNLKLELKYSPILTIGTTILITIIFLFQPENAVDKYGLTLKLISKEPWRLITNHFVHIDESHFLMNAIGLIFFCGILENTGVKRNHIIQGIIYSVIFSDLFVLSSQLIRPSIVIGFSGVVYGLIGMMILLLDWRGILGLVIIFFGLGALMMGSNIAWSGHLGGFIGGLILGNRILNS
ncbi:MAG: rhomboid family intramembrane serine protease [Candidatus Hadarchaeia archaeon]